MKADQVQIAQAHLSCCIKDYEQLQKQMLALHAQIAAFGQKRKEVGLTLIISVNLRSPLDAKRL